MPESYSVNHLKTWSKCQRKYALDVVRQLRWPSNPKNFRLGKGVHQLLDYQSRQLDLAPLIPGTDADILAVWRVLQQSRWSQLPVVASEWGFSLEIAGNWIYGRIDRIVMDEDQVCVLDWKTGTGIPLDPENDWQTIIYLYAVYEAQWDLNMAFPPERLVFRYIQVKAGQIQEVTIPYSAQKHAQTAAELVTTLRQIQQAQEYRLPAACPDRFCPYFNICGIQDPSQPFCSSQAEEADLIF